jgi:regulator of protease activity HflC (stomatin/prohibitin superfamily)
MAPAKPGADAYRGVTAMLVTATLLGAAAAAVLGLSLESPVLLNVAITLAIAAGGLVGVWRAQLLRRKTRTTAASEDPEPDAGVETRSASDRMLSPEEVPTKPPTMIEAPAFAEAVADEQAGAATSQPDSVPHRNDFAARLARLDGQVRRWFAADDELRQVALTTAACGVLGTLFVWKLDVLPVPPAPLTAGIAAASVFGVAGLAATAVRYFSSLRAEDLPESGALSQGARVVAWVLVLAAISIGLQSADLPGLLRFATLLVVVINLSLCYGLLGARSNGTVFPLEMGALRALGSRTNIVGSLLDAAERQLGIDLRSTWALAVVRRALEPLAIALLATAWLSTSVTVVGVQDQGLVERLGVPVKGPPLQPGLHLHWPVPIDRVFRVPVQRVQVLTVGHEGGEESGGPEDVLWAREHAANEYTLLLGNGRDLITIDAAIQFRIVDARAWFYHSQNPADALRAIAHRAVMRATVNKTLADALSENLRTTTARMQAMVQEEADALGLGAEILGFTVGGMHPPVVVALAYQSVVSAELGKVTAVVNAEAMRKRTVNAAETLSITATSLARAEGLQMLAQATGEAWSFLALNAQYRAAPEEYFFRRRLETMEKGLASRRYTVLDARFQRDGGEVWVIP